MTASGPDISGTDASGTTKRARPNGYALRAMMALTGVVLGIASGWWYMFAVYFPHSLIYHAAHPNFTDPMSYFGLGLVFATFHGMFYGVAAFAGALVFEGITALVTVSVVAEVVATVVGGSLGIVGVFLLAPPWIEPPWGSIYVAIAGVLGMCAFALLVLLYRGRLPRARR